MFTGIVQQCLPVKAIVQISTGIRKLIFAQNELFSEIKQGASVAVNGACLTVMHVDREEIHFEIMAETLRITNLGDLQAPDLVNIERSIKWGDEIGGHILSGHVDTTAIITSIEKNDTWQWGMAFQVSPPWLDYIFPKGFVALNGASLTVVDVNLQKNTFTVHLIPETLKHSNFGIRKEGDKVNLEIDQMTKTIVETMKRLQVK